MTREFPSESREPDDLDRLLDANIVPLDLPQVLDAASRYLRTFVYFRLEAQPIAVALWIAHTYVVDQLEQSPLLAITSPVMRSGKSRLLDALELLVSRPWRAVLPSDAVIYRYIEAEHPTLLLDEVDAIFNRKATEYEGLRALLNAGNRQGTTVPRVVGQGTKMTVKKFSVYCPKALAGIGNLPATVADRAIPIRLERRSKRDPVAKFRRAGAELSAAPIREALETLLPGLAVDAARPTIPDELDDRAADGWEPLLALADLAGGDWPALARKAAVQLQGSREQDEEAVALVLLNDVRDAFAVLGADRVMTGDLLEHLHGLEGSPWAEYLGKPLSTHGLAKLLRPFRIQSRNVRQGADVRKGYLLEQFTDTFERYLSPNSSSGSESATSLQPLQTGPDFVADSGGRSGVADFDALQQLGADPMARAAAEVFGAGS